MINFILAGLLGLAAGLLVNYLSDVLPVKARLTRPICQHCGVDLPWKEYLFFSPCHACGKSRTWRTYLVLAAGVGLALLLWFTRPAWMGYWLALLLLIFLGLVMVIDIEHRLILHSITLTGSVLGLVTGLARYTWTRTLLGGAIGLGLMLVLYGFGALFARSRARRLGVDDGEEALGFGDVTLSGVLGLMVGFPNILYALATGILLAGAFSILLILVLWTRKKFETAGIYIAYGPFLVLGAVVYLFFH
jgi:leader peptidase (prepilin peptidase)/N-methyltransferase